MTAKISSKVFRSIDTGIPLQFFISPSCGAKYGEIKQQIEAGGGDVLEEEFPDLVIVTENPVKGKRCCLPETIERHFRENIPFEQDEASGGIEEFGAFVEGEPEMDIGNVSGDASESVSEEGNGNQSDNENAIESEDKNGSQSEHDLPDESVLPAQNDSLLKGSEHIDQQPIEQDHLDSEKQDHCSVLEAKDESDKCKVFLEQKIEVQETQSKEQLIEQFSEDEMQPEQQIIESPSEELQSKESLIEPSSEELQSKESLIEPPIEELQSKEPFTEQFSDEEMQSEQQIIDQSSEDEMQSEQQIIEQFSDELEQNLDQQNMDYELTSAQKLPELSESEEDLTSYQKELFSQISNQSNAELSQEELSQNSELNYSDQLESSESEFEQQNLDNTSIESPNPDCPITKLLPTPNYLTQKVTISCEVHSKSSQQIAEPQETGPESSDIELSDEFYDSDSYNPLMLSQQELPAEQIDESESSDCEDTPIKTRIEKQIILKQQTSPQIHIANSPNKQTFSPIRKPPPPKAISSTNSEYRKAHSAIQKLINVFNIPVEVAFYAIHIHSGSVTLAALWLESASLPEKVGFKPWNEESDCFIMSSVNTCMKGRSKEHIDARRAYLQGYLRC